MDFFKYFSRDFSYNTGVASIRAGLLKKESKGWQNDVTQFLMPPGHSSLII
jgi:terminal uridylyltransferase